MNTKEIIVIIISIIIAYFAINILWTVARFLVQTVVFLVIVYVIYIFLRKLL
jgi:hypothetical protein